MAENRYLGLILTTRQDFFRREHNDSNVYRFLTNESRLISALERYDSERLLRLLPPVALTFASFPDPVIVAPTVDQRNAAFLAPDPQASSETACSICQETFGHDDARVRLRNCNHTFHRDCATTWYSRSVYCPLCRNDIREEQHNTT